jgi:hypothetical protein
LDPEGLADEKYIGCAVVIVDLVLIVLLLNLTVCAFWNHPPEKYVLAKLLLVKKFVSAPLFIAVNIP